MTHQSPSVLCTPPFEKSPIKGHRFCVLPPLKNDPSKPIGFVYSPLWEITHQRPSVLCTPPFEKSPIKAHRFCVLPPLKNPCFWWAFISGWAFISANTVSMFLFVELYYITLRFFIWKYADPMGCGNPDIKPNATLAAAKTPTTMYSLKVGDTVDYHCEVGNQMVGLANRTCLRDGSWAPAAPSCKYVDCGDLPRVKDSVQFFLQQRTTFGAEAEYACVGNLSLIGSPRTQCGAAGWSGSPPECRCKRTVKYFFQWNIRRSITIELVTRYNEEKNRHFDGNWNSCDSCHFTYAIKSKTTKILNKSILRRENWKIFLNENTIHRGVLAENFGDEVWTYEDAVTTRICPCHSMVDWLIG